MTVKGKLSLLLLIFCGLTVLHAKAQLSQKISLDLKNKSLIEVLAAIEKQAPYHFIYNRQLVEKVQVTHSFYQQKTLSDVLNHLLTQYGLTYKSEYGNIVIFSKPTKNEKKEPGKISGKILDDETAEPVPGATIIIGEKAAYTDIDGSFSILLPKGIYTALISNIGYGKKEVSGIEVKDDKVTELQTTLKREKGALSTVVVTSSAKKETVASLYVRQKNAAMISDGISAEQISRTPDKNIGESLKRISGVATVDNKYVVVRGLSERYNGAMLNGQLMPSTELNRKQFSFEFLPSNLVDNVIVYKTITPDMSAEFGGGLVAVNTKTIPTENFFRIDAGAGINNKTQGKYFTGLKIEHKQYFGSVPDHRKLFGSLSWKSNREAYNSTTITPSSFINNWKMYVYDPLPSPNLQLSFGRVLPLKNGNKLGIIGSVSYRNNWQTQDIRMSRDGYTPSDQSEEKYAFTGKTYGFNVNLSGLAGIGFTSAKTKLSYLFLHVRSMDQQLLLGTGENTMGSGGFYDNTTQTTLSQHQLKGEHALGQNGIKLTWTGSYATLNRLKPDNRAMNFGYISDSGKDSPFGTDDDFTVGLGNSSISQGVLRWWNRANEKSLNWDAAVAVPFSFRFLQLPFKNIIKTGYAGWAKDRLFWVMNTGSNFDSKKPISERFDPAYDPDGYIGISQFDDGFQKNAALHAGYAMMDNRIGNKIRLVWGVRAEYYDLNKVNQVLDSVFSKINTSRNTGDKYDYSELNNREPNWNIFPSANLTYSLTPALNLRLAYSKSIVRPDLRELSYFREYDFELGGAYSAGLIKSTLINHWDLRCEWYPGPGEIISLSFFYKKLSYPMEIYKEGTNREFELRNNKAAINKGLEIEARKSFAFTKLPVLKHITLYGNFSWLDGTVTPMRFNYNLLDPTNPLRILPGESIDPDEKRPQTGASNFMYNGGFYYDQQPVSFSLSYNYVTNRMFLPNSVYRESLFERPLESLDAQLAFRMLKDKAQLRFNISNLLNSANLVYENRYDDIDINSGAKQPSTKDKLYQKGKDVMNYEASPGRTFSFSISYRF